MTDDDVAALEQRLFDRLTQRLDARIATIKRAVDKALLELELVNHDLLDDDEADDDNEEEDE